jgi:RimJ/RimL family protein N-acetyltransferase
LRLVIGEQSMNNVTVSFTIVRNPTPDDAAQVGEAHASAWEQGYSALFAPEVLAEAAGLRRKMWRSIFADPTFDFESMFVAETDGEVVGFSHCGSNTEKNAQGEVFGFYAHPRVWGAGVATAMMEATLAELESRSLRPVIVWTHAGAGRARAFYERSGFVLTGRERIETLMPSGFEAPEVEYSLAIR